jgi:hypothetical protein
MFYADSLLGAVLYGKRSAMIGITSVIGGK